MLAVAASFLLLAHPLPPNPDNTARPYRKVIVPHPQLHDLSATGLSCTGQLLLILAACARWPSLYIILGHVRGHLDWRFLLLSETSHAAVCECLPAETHLLYTGSLLPYIEHNRPSLSISISVSNRSASLRRSFPPSDGLTHSSSLLCILRVRLPTVR